MTMGSWGHTLRPLVGLDRRRCSFSEPKSWAPHPVTELFECSACPVAHKRPAEWLATYQYVTGRAGNVSWARKYLCQEHGAKFRAKWHPAELEDPAPQHAIERLVAAGSCVPTHDD